MKKWKVLSTNKNIASESAVIDELFRLRKISDKDKFINPNVSDLKIENTSISKKEIAKTINRIEKAINNKERIIILGDYDVDGICASAILWETIYSKYKFVFPYIPDRFSEGYGISNKTIDNLLKKNPDTKLIITVDNGIVANKPIEYAKEKKIDVVVTDHHVAGKKLPDAYSIVHTTELCGAGVAYLLAKEIKNKILKIKDYGEEHLGLAALATVADLVPLTSLNRIIVKLGLKELQNTRRLGLIELFKLAKINKKDLGVYEIGHIIGPRLNASGRIDHAIESLRLLCSNDKKYVENAAMLLENTNRVRQQMVADSFEHAKLSVAAGGDMGKVVIMHHSTYSEGVVGLIASRLVEQYYRPSVAISVREKISKGSARSINGVNIVELLRSVSGILSEVGGHPMAAGFSIETERIEEFYLALNKEAKKIPDKLFERELKVDMEIPLNLVSESLYKKIQKLSPFGMGNPEPAFLVKNVQVESFKRLGKDGAHLKVFFKKGKDIIEGIGFGMGESEVMAGDKIDAVFTIDINNWRDKKSLQLKLRDIKFKQI